MVWTPTPRRPRAAGQYTTLAEELRNIDRYLNLERARFGAALNVRLQVAPEVLNVVVPFLSLQPLVENAVRHGFAGKGGGSVEIIARDEASDCVITVEDDGVGMDPETLRTGPGDALSDGAPAKEAHVGLTNVDHRLRAAFGNDYGLVVETAIGAGTKVVMRVPKFRSGVRASGGAFGDQAMNKALTVLAVDDEAPALDELAYLLDRHPDIGEVYRAGDATSALRELNGRTIDAIFLDINMPGLSGIELAGVLANFSHRPVIVFVTAHDDKAVAAFDVGAIGADALWYPVGFTAGYLGLLLFVAAPLRRSGAYTVPDFAEFRLGSARLRKVAMLIVVVICVYYLVPQYQGAGLELKALLGLPVWIGPLVVGGIVITNVVAGGMRSITFVQAFQYWLKLTAIAVPALALLGLFFADGRELGGPLPPTVSQHTTVAIETDVVVHVAAPAGVTVTGTLDGTSVDGQPIPVPGEHTLGAGTTLTLTAGAATPVVAGTPTSGAEWARRSPPRCTRSTPNG